MSSLAAEMVARQFVKQLGKTGKKPNITKLAIAQGFSPMTADSGYVQKTASFRRIVDDFINSLDDKRRSALSHITETKLRKAPPEKLAQIVDIMTKNHQLLSGGATENKAILIGSLLDKIEEENGKQKTKG